MSRGTEVGYVEVQNMIEELRRRHAALVQQFTETWGGGGPPPVTGRRDYIIPAINHGKSGEPTTALVSVAFQIRCILFFLDRAFTPSQIAYDVAAATAGSVAFGLYDEDGSLLCQWVLPTTPTGARLSSALSSPPSLAPGYYWLAWSSDTTVAGVAFGLGSANATWGAVLNGTRARLGTSPTPMPSSFILPDTLGDITAGDAIIPPIVCISSEIG